MRLNGRVAIVTRADTPVGRAVATTLARSGIAVVAHYVRHRDAAHQMVLDIHSQGGAAVAVQASTTVRSEVKALFDVAHARFGGADYVVLTANASGESEPDTEVGVQRDDELHVLAEAAHRLPGSGRVIRVHASAQTSTRKRAHLIADY